MRQNDGLIFLFECIAKLLVENSTPRDTKKLGYHACFGWGTHVFGWGTGTISTHTNNAGKGSMVTPKSTYLRDYGTGIIPVHTSL